MDAIALVDFETTPLLNAEEARLLPLLENIVRAHGTGHRVMAQTSLGELIRPRSTSGTAMARQAAYASINSKRLDFALVNRFGNLVAGVEYHGSGHYQNHAFLRDAVKREALRKAGVPLIEVPHGFNPALVTRAVISILRPDSPSLPNP